MRENEFEPVSDPWSISDREDGLPAPMEEFAELKPELKNCNTKDEARDVLEPMIRVSAIHETHPGFIDKSPGWDGKTQRYVAEITPLTEKEVEMKIMATLYQYVEDIIQAKDEWDKKAFCIKGGKCANCDSTPAIILPMDHTDNVDPDRWPVIKKQLQVAWQGVPKIENFDSIFDRI